MRSTMIWVFLPLASLNSSVSASLARSRSSDRIDFLLRLYYFLGQFEHLFQKFEASQEALFVAFLDFFQSLTQRGEFRVAEMLAQAGD